MSSKKLFLLMLLFSVQVFAGPTKVGNGDDGADLENLQKITTGILVNSKEKATLLLEKLNVRSVQYLGALSEDLAKSDMYLAQTAVLAPKEFDEGLEKSEDGNNVFARTMPTSIAPVRFFPSALTLTEEQLVRLHIHESLHHSLPPAIRENESAVSAITLAICSPQANRDEVEATVHKYMDAAVLKPTGGFSGSADSAVGVSQLQAAEAYTPRMKEPSTVAYTYQSFRLSSQDQFYNPISSMHSLQSYLHPAGTANDAWGFGLGFSWIDLSDRSYMGPLDLSLRYRLATWRKFDIEAFGQYSALTLSNEELKSLPSMRDAGTIGFSLRREAEYFYTENYLSYTLGNDKNFTVASVQYTQTYAPVIDAHVSFGGKFKDFFLGGTLDFLLTDSSVVSSGSGSFSNSTDQERVRVVKVGPEVGFNNRNFAVTLFYRNVIDSTPGYNLSDVADLMGQGSGQGYAGITAAFKF